MNSAALPDKGIRCLNSELGIPDAERFVALLLREPFDYTEWRKENLFAGMSLGQIIDEADSYCRENPQAGICRRSAPSLQGASRYEAMHATLSIKNNRVTLRYIFKIIIDA